jgi:outer membrane protein assembly factor BamC
MPVKLLPSTVFRLPAACALALLLGACSTTSIDANKIDYKSAKRGVTLEVPPDLTQLPGQPRYAMPGGAVSANSYQAGQRVAAGDSGASAAAGRIGDVHYVREGNQRWLHTGQSPDKVWSVLRDFWQESGFLLTVDDPRVGVMETDWAENRAKIPEDFIRNTLGKVLDSLYSTGERDRFRTRVESAPDGGADIYIAHQGMDEVYANNLRDSTVWQPRAADPGLEAEFLRRLMVRLGVSQEEAKAQLASDPAAAGSPQAGAAQIVTVDGQPAARFKDEFDRAWRRVGLALDRSGFTVEDRDRSKGRYLVRYADPVVQKKAPGFFAKLMGKGNAPLPTTRYQIAVKTNAGVSTVTVLKEDGAVAQSSDAQRIIKVLAGELK